MIEQVLTPTQLALFRRFDLADRQHSFAVMRTLQEAGHENSALLAAALLHDIGKTQYRLHLWERVIGAVVEAVRPSLIDRWGQGDARGLRRPFVIRSQHPQWGAEMVAGAGASSVTITLIRHHQDKTCKLPDRQTARLLSQLQWADDRN